MPSKSRPHDLGDEWGFGVEVEVEVEMEVEMERHSPPSAPTTFPSLHYSSSRALVATAAIRMQAVAGHQARRTIAYPLENGMWRWFALSRRAGALLFHV